MKITQLQTKDPPVTTDGTSSKQCQEAGHLARLGDLWDVFQEEGGRVVARAVRGGAQHVIHSGDGLQGLTLAKNYDSDRSAAALAQEGKVVAIVTLPVWGHPQIWLVPEKGMDPAHVATDRVVFSEKTKTSIRILATDARGHVVASKSLNFPPNSLNFGTFNLLGGVCVAYLEGSELTVHELDPGLEETRSCVVRGFQGFPTQMVYDCNRRLWLERRLKNDAFTVKSIEIDLDTGGIRRLGERLAWEWSSIMSLEYRRGPNIVTTWSEGGVTRLTARTPWGRPCAHALGPRARWYALPHGQEYAKVETDSHTTSHSLRFAHEPGDEPPPVKRLAHLVRALLGRGVPLASF